MARDKEEKPPPWGRNWALAAAELPLLWASFNPMTQNMTKRLPLFLLALCLFVSAPASAQAPISDVGAQALKTQIEDMIARQKNAKQLSGGALLTEGHVVVEQADSYYAVTLPDITVKDHKGESAEIGIIAINAVPEATPGDWKLSVSVPTPITWKNAAGTPVRKMSLGGQRLSGQWKQSLAGFSTLDGAYNNVVVDDLIRQKTYKIANVGLVSNLKETAAGIWSGDTVATIKGLNGSGAPGAGTTTADSITLTATVKDLSAAKRQQMREQIGAFAENTNPKDLETLSPAGQLALFNMVVDLMRSGGSGFSFKADLKNFAAAMPAQGILPARNLSIKDGTIGLNLAGFETGKVTLGVISRLDDLVSTPSGNPALMPSDMNLDMKIQNLPFEELVKIGQDSLKTAGRGGAAKQFAGIQAMISLPQVLSAAGANVTITNSTFSNATADAKLDGKMTADMNATMGATGRMKGEVSGLDAVIASLQKQANDTTDAAKKARLQKTVQNLTVFNLAGQAENRGGKTVKTYDFELTPTGQMLLNGSDLSILTGGATAGKPKAR